MAGEKQPTPEKQLLKLIEEPKTKEINPVEALHKTRRLFSRGALSARFSFFKKKVQDGRVIKKPSLAVNDINNILKVCIFGLVVYLSWSFMNDQKILNKGVMPEVEKTYKVASAIVGSPLALKKKTYYLEQIRKRNIFSLVEEKPELSVVEEKKKVIPQIVELTKDLVLVGISWSDSPEVMIEDKKASRTFFRKRGEMINDKIKVQGIFKDKVILSYEGQEKELR